MKRKVIRILSRVFFALYMFVLIYLLFLSELFGRGVPYTEFRYNIIPFQEIIRFCHYPESMAFWINVPGNVVAFMPYGALLRWVWDRKTRWYHAFGYTLLFSFIVECVQLITKVGSFDVDDLLLNTLGGLSGFWIYCILTYINRRSEQHAERKRL